MQKGIFINFDSEKVPSVTVLVASGSRTVKNGIRVFQNISCGILSFRVQLGVSMGHFGFFFREVILPVPKVWFQAGSYSKLLDFISS